MSASPRYVLGTLVQLGTPDGETQPRALVHCTEDEIRDVQCTPLLQRVAIVPLENLHGSTVPPIVRECVALRAALATIKDRVLTDEDFSADEIVQFIERFENPPASAPTKS